MGWLQRLHSISTGVTGPIGQSLGLTWDLARNVTETAGQYSGFDIAVGKLGINVPRPKHNLLVSEYDSIASRGGATLSDLIGPTHGLGAAIGGLPVGVRKPVGYVVHPIQSGLNAAYNEGVSQPISAAITAASLSDAPGGGGPLHWFSHLAEGYHIAEHRSPGQALALAIGTKDITDPNQVERTQRTDFYHVSSGISDALLRWQYDPGQLAGRSLTEFRTGRNLLDSQAAIDGATASGRFHKYAESIEGMNPAQIRRRDFPHHADGAAISTILGGDGEPLTVEQRVQALRVLAGARDELDSLAAERPAVAAQIDRLQRNEHALTNLTNSGFQISNSADKVAQIQAETDALYPVADRLDRLAASAGVLREIPRARLIDSVRSSVVRSDSYQNSIFGSAVRSVVQMQFGHGPVPIAAADGDIRFWRYLEHSKVPLAEAEDLRSQYMRADPGTRLQLWQHTEDRAVASIAEKAGMTPAEISATLAEASRQRGVASAVLTGRQYAGNGLDVFRHIDDDGTLVETHLPMMQTQLGDYYTPANLDDIRQAASKIGRFRLRHPTTDIPTDLLTGFYNVWRPAVLLRVGWPIRTVTDSQLRVMAQIGALAQLKNIAKMATHKFDEVGVGDNLFDGMFGAPGDGANIWKKMISIEPSLHALYDPEQLKLLDRLRSTGQWRSVTPDHPEYATAWEHAVNHQMGQDVAVKKLLGGSTATDLAQWVKSADGRGYLKQLPPLVRQDPEQWAARLADLVDYYLPTDGLKADALAQKASAERLAKVVTDPTVRPIVHGQILEQMTGRSTTYKLLKAVTDKMHRYLGQLPEDTLTRQPYASHLYAAEVRRQAILEGGETESLDATTMERISEQARKYAANEVKIHLHDLTERSDLAGTIKFLSPFFAAYQQIVTRWVGILAEHPDSARRLQLLARSPEAMGVVHDEHGNTIGVDGKITKAVEGFKVGQPGGTDHIIYLPIPKWAKDLPIVGPTAKNYNKIALDKSAFNLALHGAPPVGPIVGVAANQIAKNRPDLVKSLKWALPFGQTTQDTWSLLLPSTAKNIGQTQAGEDDRLFRNTALRIYYDDVVTYNLKGHVGPAPSWTEAQSKAHHMYMLRTLAGYLSPAPPQFVGPYQAYIDAYRGRLEYDRHLTRDQHADPSYQTPEEWFLDKYGAEFFPLTQSLSKSMNGVPPTLEGFKAAKNHAAILAEHPELGNLILGSEGAGEFNSAVYAYQLAHKLAPGSPHNQREAPSAEQAIASPNVRLGWITYSRAMDLLDAARIQRGLPSFTVKGAKDLLALKQQVTASIVAKYPDWADDFYTVDERSMQKRIAGMSAIVADPSFEHRKDIIGLKRYLAARQVMVEALQARKSQVLTAQSNADLYETWQQIVGQLVEKHLAFGDLYHRYLEGDQSLVAA